MWEDDLQRHCEEVYDDKEETAEKQKERIMKFKTGGDKDFTDGRCRNYCRPPNCRHQSGLWCSEPGPKLMTQNLELRKKNSPNCEVLSSQMGQEEVHAHGGTEERSRS